MATAEDLRSSSASMHTYLFYVDSTGKWQKLANIKDTPAMGGSPEQIETTTLSEEKSTFVTGVQSLSTFEFTANYTFTDFVRIDGLKNSTTRISLCFGKEDSTYGTLGRYEWNGKISVWTEGFSVNAAREMKISISAETEVQFMTIGDPPNETPVTIQENVAATAI